MKKSTAISLYAICALVLLAADRATKWLAVSADVRDYQLFPGVSCDVAFNRGISWGMLSFESCLLFGLVTLMNCLITAWVIRLAWQRWQQRRCIAGELMVVCGALSNIIDRVWYGAVVDFIDCSIGSWHWPTFNIADCAIVAGVALMIWFHARES